jgi:endonuclease/exonuclease/phosphatase family metal-dependent hydrolase
MVKGHEYPNRLEFFLKVITFGFALSMSSALLTQYVPPTYFIFFQWVGICFPVLLVANAALLIYWAIRRKNWLFLPLVALSSNIAYYPRIYQLPFSKLSKHDSVADIVVASYNVHNFQLDYGGSSLTNIAELMEGKHVQVLCLQEVPEDVDSQTLLQAFHWLPYITSTQKTKKSTKVVVLSAFPIKSNQTISFPERANCAILVDLAVRGKPLRILTCHLQTTNWNQIKSGPSFGRSKGIGLGDLIDNFALVERNFEYRASQVDSLAKIIAQTPNPTIVCGDFNDSPISYTYHKMRGNLDDSFSECGKGYGYTYRYLHKLFRIDYLFYTPASLKANYYESPEVEYSDHKPIIIGLAWVN